MCTWIYYIAHRDRRQARKSTHNFVLYVIPKQTHVKTIHGYFEVDNEQRTNSAIWIVKITFRKEMFSAHHLHTLICIFQRKYEICIDQLLQTRNAIICFVLKISYQWVSLNRFTAMENAHWVFEKFEKVLLWMGTESLHWMNVSDFLNWFSNLRRSLAYLLEIVNIFHVFHAKRRIWCNFPFFNR